MCGIVGSINAVHLSNLLLTIEHRGPDASKSYTDGNVYLGRLFKSTSDTETLLKGWV